MSLIRGRKLVWLGILAGILLVTSCGDDDGGGNGGVTPTAPQAPESFTFAEELLSDPDVPPQVSGMAAMASGMMQMGQGFMSSAASGGTASGGGCWEWSWVDQQYGAAILIEACEETDGSADWRVTVTEAGADPCVVLLGEVAANGLSGQWRFRDCECDTTVLISEWSTNSAASQWIVDLMVLPVDCARLRAVADVGDTLLLHYESYSDGSGSMAAYEDSETLWTAEWQISAGEVSGTLCLYEENVLQECIDFGGGMPQLPTQFELDPELIGAFEENLPDSALSVIGSIAGFQGMGQTWIDLATGEGEQEDGCWVWRMTSEGYQMEIWVCEEANQVCAEVKLQCEAGGPLVTRMEICEQRDGSQGWMTIHDCGGQDLVHAEWAEQNGGWDFTMTMPNGVFVYTESADGSGSCSWTLMEIVIWDCTWNASYHGTYCWYGLAGGPPDCLDF